MVVFILAVGKLLRRYLSLETTGYRTLFDDGSKIEKTVAIAESAL